MATFIRPSSAPLFADPGQDDVSSSPRLSAPISKTDEQAGWPSRETGTDPLIEAPGSHQFLGHQANHHDSEPTKLPTANRLQQGQPLPQVLSPPVGAPTPVQPFGAKAGNSIYP